MTNTIPDANILVVDDVPENLLLLVQILTQQNYDLRVASDGESALKAAGAEPPDLVLLDINMPDMDGYAVCKRLKADERTRDIPVIFISGLDDVTDKVKGFDAGGSDYIAKPFESKEVLARVKTHLRISRLQEELQRKNAALEEYSEQVARQNTLLQEKNAQLDSLNASKDKFFSIVAHDLRAPFTGLLGLTEVIIEDIDRYGKDRIKSMLEKLLGTSKTVYSLLKNLLEWSQLQQGAMKAHPDDIFLDQLAEYNMHLFTSNAEQKQIGLESSVPAKLGAYADLKMVDTVLRNLISNAFKFTESGGTIGISAREHQHSVELVVSDTGVGMTPDILEKLFRIDHKHSTRGTAGEKGTGLGLVLCKELVEKNGGDIRLESEAGQGTTVRVTLPKRRV